MFFLDDKSQVQKVFKNFARKAQNQFDVKIKKVRSDNGMEFKNANVDTFLDEEGISHEFSATYTPQQNGVVERKNRTLIEMARTMLDEYKAPRKFWTEAIDTACHTINRVYLHKLLNKTSYELLTGKKPNVSYFRVFGARCWIKDPHHTSKFAPKAHEGFMLGYGKDSHSYRVFNLFHYKVVETVDVRFDETNGSQREQLPSVLDEVPSSESIKLMGTGEKLYLLKLILKKNLSSQHLINMKTMLSLKTFLPTTTQISKSKVFALYILVLPMKCRLIE